MKKGEIVWWYEANHDGKIGGHRPRLVAAGEVVKVEKGHVTVACGSDGVQTLKRIRRDLAMEEQPKRGRDYW